MAANKPPGANPTTTGGAAAAAATAVGVPPDVVVAVGEVGPASAAASAKKTRNPKVCRQGKTINWYLDDATVGMELKLKYLIPAAHACYHDLVAANIQ